MPIKKPSPTENQPHKDLVPEPLSHKLLYPPHPTYRQNFDEATEFITYKKNLTILEKHHPVVYTQLQALTPTASRISNTSDGLNGEIIQNQQAHILHKDIAAEIAPALQQIKDSSYPVICFIGAGLGYPLFAIHEARPNSQRFILIEPIIEILQMALVATDLTSLLCDPRLIIITGETPVNTETIGHAVQQLQFEDCYIYKHIPTWHLSQQYKLHADQIYALTNELNMSGSTMIAMGDMFMRNRFANLTIMTEARPLTATKELCHDTTAVLVTAGPSLDKNVKILKEYQDSICIISADSAFPTLLKHDIMPDFVTSLDPQNMVFEKLSHVLSETAQTNLICSMGVCPKIPKYFPFKQTFISFNSSNIETQLAAQAGSSTETYASDSSPHLSLYAAITMGASTIIFIGHDLAYTGEKSHAENTAIPTDLKAIGAGKEISNPDILWTQDIYGQKIKTTRSFLNSKAHFEVILKNHNRTYINATEGGIGILGSSNQSLSEALGQTDQKQNWVTQKEYMLNKIPPINMGKVTNYLNQTKQEMLAAAKQTKELLKILQKLNKAIPKSGLNSYANLNKKQQKLLKQHDQINATIHRETNLFNLVDELTVQGVRDSNRLQTTIQQTPKEQYTTHLRKVLQRSKFITTTYSAAINTMIDHITPLLEFQKNTLHQKSAWQQVKVQLSVDNIAHAKQLFKENEALFSETNGEAYFHMGCIAAKQLNPSKMHSMFANACAIDRNFTTQVAHFEATMQKEFLEELYYALPAVKQTLTLRMLQFWGGTGVSARDLVNFIDSNTSISLAHGLMAKKELIMENVAEGHQNYALLQIKEGKNKEAIDTLHIALSFAPNNDKVQMTLVQEYFDTGNFSDAVHHLQLAVQINPKHGENWETIGDYLMNENQTTDARAAYENCHAALPKNRAILLKIKQCYEKDGHLDAAEKIQQLYNRTAD